MAWSASSVVQAGQLNRKDIHTVAVVSQLESVGSADHHVLSMMMRAADVPSRYSPKIQAK